MKSPAWELVNFAQENGAPDESGLRISPDEGGGLTIQGHGHSQCRVLSEVRM